MTSPALELEYITQPTPLALRVDRLAGNIGLLSLGDTTIAIDRSRILDVMRQLADTDALLIDVRHARALDPGVAALVASWLFDTAGALAPERYLPSGATPARGAEPALPRYLGRDVLVVVGPETGTVAADLARNLQRLQRAKIVGESPRARRVSANVHAPTPLARRMAHLVALTALQTYRDGRSSPLALQAAIVGVRRELEQLRARGVGRRKTG